jgi:flagellar P-ring protein precursor FlgI
MEGGVRNNQTRFGMIGAVLALGCLIAGSLPAQAARVKDIAQLDGVRSNQLIGFGLVGGLAGTGDDPKNAPYTRDAIANMLTNFGFTLTPAQINVRNFAAVMITADLPAYAGNGSTIDVTLSSAGSAKSLEGGVLYRALLKGADGKTYAVAQGPLSLGDRIGGGSGGGRGKHLTTARIPGGATVEADVPSTIQNAMGELRYNLHNPDFSTASKLATAINRSQGSRIAHADSAGSVSISVPDQFARDLVPFIAALESLDIEPSSPARVVINQRTGTVVMGENVSILPVAVTHSDMTLTFGRQLAVPGAPPAEPSDGGGNVPLEVVGESSASAQPQSARGVLREPTTAAEVALGLNKMQLKPADVIAIFEAIDAAGALQGELEII